MLKIIIYSTIFHILCSCTAYFGMRMFEKRLFAWYRMVCSIIFRKRTWLTSRFCVESCTADCCKCFFFVFKIHSVEVNGTDATLSYDISKTRQSRFSSPFLQAALWVIFVRIFLDVTCHEFEVLSPACRMFLKNI